MIVFQDHQVKSTWMDRAARDSGPGAKEDSRPTHISWLRYRPKDAQVPYGTYFPGSVLHLSDTADVFAADLEMTAYDPSVALHAGAINSNTCHWEKCA